MKNMTKRIIRSVLLIAFCILSVQLNSVNAQQIFGLSVGYETFPYAKLVEPITGAPDLEIQATSLSLGAALPFGFAEGKVIVMNQFNYKRTEFNYHNLPDDDNDIEKIHSISYTAFMIDSLSHKWKMVAITTPGLASDFEGDLTIDDFTFGAVFGFIKRINEKLDLGFGLAYMPDFGEPYPMPFVYTDWKINPKMNVSGILPSDLTLLYKFNPKIDLGLTLKIDGNRYHGDPKKFGVDNPLLKYSEGTLSPTVNVHFSKWIHLNVEGGFAFYRNFEFFDGVNQVQSLDLERTGYVKTMLVVGL
ncbi:DUF6268 family outer membrane beta-barrel protein [Candidatus Neomarinimicrobiota bacterium]